MDLAGAERLVGDLRARIDDMWSTISGVRDRLTQTLQTAITEVLPKAIEAFGMALAQMGTLVTGLLEHLATTDDLGDMLYRALVGQPAERAAAAFGESTAAQVKATLEQRSAEMTPASIVREMETMPGLLRGLLSWAGLAVNLLGYLQAMQAGNVEEWRQASFISTRPMPLSPPEAVQALKRGFVTADTADDYLARSGLDDQAISALMRLYDQLLPPSEVVRLERLGFMSAAQASTHLAAQGWTAEEQQRLRLAMLATPTPQDVVAMAGREAFEPDAVAALGLDAEYNAVDWSEAERIGLVEPWRRYWWRAHWTPMPLSYAYEAYHRGFMSDADLDQIFRQHEVLPKAREWLTKISYAPLTRVDVRRMHDLGELGFDDVVRAYRDLGYDEMNAARLARFSQRLVERGKARQLEQSAGPARRAVLGSYADGAVSRAEAQRMIEELGFSADDTAGRLDALDVERARDQGNAVRRAVGNAYTRDLLSEQAAREALASEGFAAQEIEHLIATWRPDRAYRLLAEAEREQRDLSKTEILAGYREGLADAGQTTTWLEGLGYDAAEARALVALEDARAARAQRTAVEQATRTLYLKRRVSTAEARARLGRVGLAEQRADVLIERWTVERDEAAPDLSLSQLEELARNDMIDAAELAQELEQRGFSARDIERLLALWGQRMALAEEKLELERQKVAQQRELALRREDLQRELQTAKQAGTLEQIAARLQGQLTLDERRALAAASRLDTQIRAQEQRQERELTAREKLQAQRTDVQQQLAGETNAIRVRSLEAQDRRLQLQLEAREQQLALQATERQRLEQLRASLRAEADERADQRRIATEQRTEARKIGSEQRAFTRQLQTQALKVTEKRAEAEARAVALAAVEAQIRDMVAALVRQVVGTLDTLSAQG